MTNTLTKFDLKTHMENCFYEHAVSLIFIFQQIFLMQNHCLFPSCANNEQYLLFKVHLFVLIPEIVTVKNNLQA